MVFVLVLVSRRGFVCMLYLVTPRTCSFAFSQPTPSRYADKNWMLDGFPRSVEQAGLLDAKYKIDFAVNIDVPFDTIVERLSSRWTHGASGVYYYTALPPSAYGLNLPPSPPFNFTHQPLSLVSLSTLLTHTHTHTIVLTFLLLLFLSCFFWRGRPNLQS